MITAIVLRALVVLVALPGLPRLPGIGNPIKWFKHHKAAPRDTIPPVWKSSSRLALEDQFVHRSLLPLTPRRVGIRVQQGMDPRRYVVEVNPDSGTITSGTRLGEIPLGPQAAGSLTQYARQIPLESFREAWRQTSIRSLNTMAGKVSGATGTGFPGSSFSRPGLSFQLPSPLPQKIQNLLGPGGPALNVSGSENISLSGTSSWSNQQIGLIGQRRSLFPSLDMQQNLDIRLEGQLSDRIKVNLLQNSANQIPLANRIAINYKGGEDDLVQEFDLGNTNLSLPGTQYVSYSGRNEGLFGVKSALRYGPLDFTMLASKQEGRSERASYAGGASRQTPTIADLDYIQGIYFLLYDPNGRPRVIDEGTLKVYKDDYSYGNLANKILGRAMLEPARTLESPGDTTYVDTVSVRGSYKQLERGADKDFELLNDLRDDEHRYLRLRVQLSGDQKLAVSYDFRYVDSPETLHHEGGQDVPIADTTGAPTERWMKLLRAPASLLTRDPETPDFFDTNTVVVLPGQSRPRAPLNATRELELRNFYNLGGTNIDPRTFTIRIRHGYDDPPRLTFTDPGLGQPIPYIELLGLDSRTQADSLSVALIGHDGRVDQSPINPHMRSIIDYTNGTLMFPDLHPFAPRLDRQRYPFEAAIDSAAFVVRRATLTGGQGSENVPNRNVYDSYIVLHSQAAYYMDVEYTAQRSTGEIYLGRSNIVEGSETVTINGLALLRDKDYTIDYDLGKIRLIRQLGPADNLSIDYSYAPLFQQAGRTLLGGAFQLAGRDRGFGGAFLYESRGAQDLRPRLGEEPSRSLIADLNTNWAFKPEWMTRLADRLPGVRTTAPSDFNLQAEAGQSFPNPNTRNEVFIDDMEGARDAVSLSLDPSHWRLSSVPLREINGAEVEMIDSTRVPNTSNVELHWFSPPSGFQERELKPNLSTGQGAQNFHQTLCLTIPRVPQHPEWADAKLHRYQPGDALWCGLTYILDPAGLDLSRSQFIELWVNDWRDRHDGQTEVPRVRGKHVKLHIDIGTVSEDQMPAPNKAPNGSFDTEDLNRDGVLAVTGTTPEDVGIDGELDGNENDDWDLTTRTDQDRHGDDFQTVNDQNQKTALDSRKYLGTNGTEGDHTVYPFPDTEDLNGNQNLDLANNYLEYSIDLGDTTNLITDVYRDYRTYANDNSAIPLDNGWRRFRIPLADSTRLSFGNPNLVFARNVRIWLEGMTEGDSPTPDPLNQERPFLVLGGLDIVGSRWLLSDLSSHGRDAGTTATLNTVNNVDNADIYTVPFDPGRTREGNQEVTRREQSITLEFTHLTSRDSLEAYRTFSVDEDYSRYKALDWWVSGFFTSGADVPAARQDSLAYFVRFASDEQGLNYYEYRAPLPLAAGQADWHEIRLQLTDLSNLKLEPHFPTLDPIHWDTFDPATGVHRIVHGRPSFTRLRRISFGLMTSGDSAAASIPEGQIWLDEIRATDVARDVGRAGRFFANGHFANLLSYNTAFDYRDADFLTVGQTRGSGSATRALTFGASMDLHRFFEGTGITLPVSFSGAWNDLQPRFNAGDDVVRTGAYEAASRSANQTRSFSTTYSRAWSDRSNPFLRYSVGGITASFNQSNSLARNPSSRSTSDSKGWAVNYGISPRRLLALGMPRSKLKFYPLPERIFWNYSIALSRQKNWQRSVVSQDTVLNTLLSDVNSRTAGVDFGADNRPFDFLHHHIEAHRNLVLPEAIGKQSFLGVHVGRVTSWSQGSDARFSLNRGAWMRPSFSWTSSYTQNNGPEISPDLSVRSIGNGQQMTMSWELPFETLARGKKLGVTPGDYPDINPYVSPGVLPRGGNPPVPPGTAPPGGPPGGPDTSGTPPRTPPGNLNPARPGATSGTLPPPPPSGGAPTAPAPSAAATTPVPTSGSAPAAAMPSAPAATPAPGESTGTAPRGSGPFIGPPAPSAGGQGAAGDSLAQAARHGPPETRLPGGLNDSLAVTHDSLAVRRDTLGTRPGATAADTLGTRPGATAADTLGARPHATAADTTVRRPARRRPAFHFDLGGLIAHIGTIGTEATFSQSSAYTRVGGTPDFFYLFGLRPNPGGYGEGGRVAPLTGNTRTSVRDLRLGAHTRIVLPFGVFLQTRADFETRGNEVNGLLTQQITHHYPYFDVDYGSLAKTIRLERFLQHPQLRTTFDRNLVYDYAAGSATVTGIARSTELRPLLGVTGELKNRTRIDLRVDTRNTTRENRLLGSSLDFDRSVDAKLDLSRQYSQGQKVAFLGKESTVRSSISLGLSTVYSRLNRGTVVNGNIQQPSLETRLSVSGTGSYGFSDNVNGNASIGYSQNHDLIRDLITRSLRVELRAQFTF